MHFNLSRPTSRQSLKAAVAISIFDRMTLNIAETLSDGQIIAVF